MRGEEEAKKKQLNRSRRLVYRPRGAAPDGELFDEARVSRGRFLPVLSDFSLNCISREDL